MKKQKIENSAKNLEVKTVKNNDWKMSVKEVKKNGCLINHD